MTIYYIHAVHTMKDGTLTASGKVVNSPLTWGDFLTGPAKDYLCQLAETQGGVDHLMAYHVHTEPASGSLAILHKVFQPEEVRQIVEEG